jgi:tetratricopeptide (TPR) repeat protein
MDYWIIGKLHLFSNNPNTLNCIFYSGAYWFSLCKENLKHATKRLSEDATFFQKIPNEELTDTLLNKHNYEDGHLEVLSELFRAQAELFYAQGQYDDSREYYQKSLTLLDFVTKNSATFSFDKEMKVDELKNKVEELN